MSIQLPRYDVLLDIPRYDGFSTPVLQSALDAVSDFLGVRWPDLWWCRQGLRLSYLPNVEHYCFDRYRAVVSAIEDCDPEIPGVFRCAQGRYPDVKFLALHRRGHTQWLVTQPFIPGAARLAG